MSVLDIQGDAQKAFQILEDGGTCILPMDVGYAFLGGSFDSVMHIFNTKKRANTKYNAVIGNMDHHKAVHVVSPRGSEIVSAIVEDYDLPLGIIAPCNPQHELFKSINQELYERSTVDDTLAMLTNAGKFHAEITRLIFAANKLVFGSSANVSTTGTRFRVEDIQDEIKDAADMVINYGPVKYTHQGMSSTLLNVETLEVVRFGCCYENIADILKRHFKIDMPSRPDNELSR
ncbi:MAG: Sua5/YciO/YrdC/YwlC family protein [Porticoccaceae bacterium]|nr:Sua5/YciO/YrdC/YwlC family protein [Porticoccaceae bacterium]